MLSVAPVFSAIKARLRDNWWSARRWCLARGAILLARSRRWSAHAADVVAGLARRQAATIASRLHGRDPVGAGSSGSPPGLMAWIWRESRKDQLVILAIIACSMPFYFLLLDLPKHIINGPIQGVGFGDVGATQSLSKLVPLAAQFDVASAVQLDRWSALVMLSCLFAALIIVNGAFKLAINTAKGRLGEAMLMRLRGDLFGRVLAMPSSDARKLSGAATASIIKDEVEPLGGFIGDAFVVPVLLGAQALTAALFILLQNKWLGAFAISIVVLQALIIPRLRRRLIALGRERQLTARELAGRVGEVVDGIADVHANNAAELERLDVRTRLERIFQIRYEIFKRKFAIKFLNNMLAQVPPLVFFLLGGLLVLRGQLDVGQLVAVLVAYRELPTPVKELIDWDYQRQDMIVRFEQVMRQLPLGEASPPTASANNATDGAISQSELLPVEVSALAAEVEETGESIRGIDFSLRAAERVCAIGEPGSGAGALALALIGEAVPRAGAVRLGGRSVAPNRTLLGGAIAYAGEDPFVKNSTIRAALLYGAGDTAVDDQRLGDILELVRLEDDILGLALVTRFAADERGDLASIAIAARRALDHEFTRGVSARLVVRHDLDRYNDEATLAENLVLGYAASKVASGSALLGDAVIAELLVRYGIDRRLVVVGKAMATTAIDTYGDLQPDNPLRTSQRYLPPHEFDRYRPVLRRSADGVETDDVAADQRLLMTLALSYIEPQHRLGLLDDDFKSAVLKARQALVATPSGDLASAGSMLHPDRYSDALTLEQNIIFGSVVYEMADAERSVRRVIRETLAALGQLGAVVALGLDTATGAGGRRLSLAQRQKLGLARALLKDSRLLVVHRALSASSAPTHDAIVRDVLAWLARRPGGNAVFWVLASPTAAASFDVCLEFAGGTLLTGPGHVGLARGPGGLP